MGSNASMPIVSVPVRRTPTTSVAALLLLSLSTACAPFRSESPPLGSAGLTGHWVLDKAASDSVTAKVDHAVATAVAEFRRRHPGAGGGQGGAGGAGGASSGGAETGASQTRSDADESGAGGDIGVSGLLGPDFRALRARLLLALSPPAALRFEFRPDYVLIKPDEFPAREYPPDEVFSIIDEYGAAIIDSGWSEQAFVVRARYAHGVVRLERYAVDPHTDTLSVTRTLNDPMAGKIELHSVYRRR